MRKKETTLASGFQCRSSGIMVREKTISQNWPRRWSLVLDRKTSLHKVRAGLTAHMTLWGDSGCVLEHLAAV